MASLNKFWFSGSFGRVEWLPKSKRTFVSCDDGGLGQGTLGNVGLWSVEVGPISKSSGKSLCNEDSLVLDLKGQQQKELEMNKC